MAHSVEEWLRQADYDLETAEFMLRGGRRFYAVFMAHLAVEKSLKGVTEDLAALQREFNAEVAGEILTKSKEVVEWAKTQL